MAQMSVPCGKGLAGILAVSNKYQFSEFGLYLRVTLLEFFCQLDTFHLLMGGVSLSLTMFRVIYPLYLILFQSFSY